MLGPGLRKCFACTTDWYGAGRGRSSSRWWRGRPIRNRVVDVFTPVSTFVGLANQLDEQGVRWQVVPNFVPDSLLSTAPVPRDPALPSGDYFFLPATCPTRRAWTPCSRRTRLWTRPPARRC